MYKKIGVLFVFAEGLYAGENINVESIETFWIWIALFALGIIGIIILFFSSKQMLKIQKIHEDMFNKQLEMEQKQALILTNMSENIHDMAKKALERSTQAIEKVNASFQNEEIINNVEDTLLDVTNDLIEFLRLKSKKVEIINEEFNVNNVLNEVSGTICSQYNGSNVELIFDIDNNIPRLLIGDSLHLGQILTNILENMMEMLTDEELKLKISMFNTFEDKVELEFQIIDNGTGMSEEALGALFSPYYDEENSKYVGLGLFVAKELVDMMDGELSVHSNIGKGSMFTLTLPFEKVDADNKRIYRLPEKILTDKKVFIVDSNYNAALAIKKMFAYFKHDVKVISQEKFVKTMPNLKPYDIVVLDEGLLNVRTIEYLKQLKDEKELKVVSLNSLLRVAQSDIVDDVIDKIMLKPLNQERIFEMITSMYALRVSPIYMNDEMTESKKAKIYKSHIAETKNVTQHSFSDFRNKHILIVEDNIINQKVLVNLLHQSGIKITIATNGREAVELVKEDNEEEFDLILMDINMPVMDGYAATQAIRYEKRFDTLPIVAFTALVLDSEIQKMFHSGINAFLAKPLNVGKLYTALAMFLLEIPKEQNEENISYTTTHYALPGLDIKAGVRHSNNSEALYIEVLKEFVEAYEQSDKVFEKLVNEHRYEQLRMLCLDMKGLSGSIGASDMHIKIDEIHKLILYNKHNLLVNYIDVYRKELLKLVQSIDLYIKAQ